MVARMLIFAGAIKIGFAVYGKPTDRVQLLSLKGSAVSSRLKNNTDSSNQYQRYA
jgi:hypothetical protein